MSQYKIYPYSYGHAERLKVEIKPSKNPNKKIDVFRNGELVASIGDIRYKDYPTYIMQERQGIVKRGTANRARWLYHKRHAKDGSIEGTAGFYAMNILW